MELCKICHAGCCKRYNPTLLGSDIIKISEALKVDMFFFISVIKYEKDQAKKLQNKKPLFIFTEAGSDLYFSIILKSNLSMFYPDTTKCIFLQEWSAEAMCSTELSGIVGRCGIYEIRPLACRKWPAMFDDENNEVIIQDPYLVLEKIPDKPQESQAYSICPKPLNHQDLTRFVDSYNNSAVKHYQENLYFLKLAKKWNENPDVSDNLYKFIKREYNNRIIHIME